MDDLELLVARWNGVRYDYIRGSVSWRHFVDELNRIKNELTSLKGKVYPTKKES